MHPRISILGVTIVTPRHVLEQLCNPAEVDTFVCNVITAISNMVGPQLNPPGNTPPSIVVLHADCFADGNVVSHDTAELLIHYSCPIPYPPPKIQFFLTSIFHFSLS